MHVGADSSKPLSINVEGSSDGCPLIDVSLNAPATTNATIADTILAIDGTHVDDDGIQPEVPHDEVVCVGTLSAQICYRSLLLHY